MQQIYRALRLPSTPVYIILIQSCYGKYKMQRNKLQHDNNTLYMKDALSSYHSMLPISK